MTSREVDSSMYSTTIEVEVGGSAGKIINLKIKIYSALKMKQKSSLEHVYCLSLVLLTQLCSSWLFLASYGSSGLFLATLGFLWFLFLVIIGSHLLLLDLLGFS